MRDVSLTNWQQSGMSGTSGWNVCLSCTTLDERLVPFRGKNCLFLVRPINHCFNIHMLLVVISNGQIQIRFPLFVISYALSFIKSEITFPLKNTSQNKNSGIK